MKDETRSKKSLIRELDRLRHRVNELEAALGVERERAEENLSEAELRYEKLTEISDDGIVVVEDGVIIEADDKVAEIARRSPEDLVGLQFKELLTAEHENKFGDLVQPQECEDLEAELPTKDGEKVPVSISTGSLSQSDSLVIAAFKDLTPVKKVEKQRIKTEERFRALFEASPDVIYFRDLDLRFTHVNPAMESLFGKKASELLKSRDEDLYEKKVFEQLRKWDARVLEGNVIEVEHTRSINGDRYTFLDIRVPLCDEDDRIYGLCCISRDITDYKRAVPKMPAKADKCRSKAMSTVLEQANKIAHTDGTILLLGESGSGKDHIARWIHESSPRSSGPYFAINCAALSSELAESELFGHESGAFTGARGRKKGMLELAEGGTLLLNEIGELPLPLQSKLLTFLDTLSYMRVGGEKSVTVDVRILAATHRNLEEEVSTGRFLEPLYYRLSVFILNMPPLRDRLDDLPILVKDIINELAIRMNLSEAPVIETGTIEGLAAYDWPGNVRELKNAIERALMLWDGGRFKLKLPARTKTDEKWMNDLPFPSYWTLREVTDEITKSMCIEALRRAKGNKKEAAGILGVSRDALYRYMRRFKIKPEMLS